MRLTLKEMLLQQNIRRSIAMLRLIIARGIVCHSSDGSHSRFILEIELIKKICTNLNPLIWLKKIQENPIILKIADLEMRKNSIFVLDALKKNGLALEYAFRGNVKFVMTAVTQNGLALRFAVKS